MKKLFLIGVLLIAVFLAGCETDLPPEPGAPGAPIGEAIEPFDGYAPPYDVFDNDKQVFFLGRSVFVLHPDQESLELGVAVNHEDGFIYRYGYYYTDAGWQQYEFPGKLVRGSNWIKDNDGVWIDIITKDIALGENYVTAYSCKKYDRIWRCGCSSVEGPCNQWMLQTYSYTLDLPTKPTGPDKEECYDSDGGKNYYVKGTMTDTSTSKTDRCFNDGTNMLAEYYCEGNKQINYDCPNGCEDGACIKRTVCGNNICEEGEAPDCPVCVPGDVICSKRPCITGTCPKDCEIVIGEESWKVETSNSKLELSENLKSGINEESIADITEQSFISNTELPNVLASGTASNKKGDFSYNQKLYFEDDESTGYVQLTESEEDVTTDFLYFKSGREIARYELGFTTSMKSDVKDDALVDFENIQLTMMGKNYEIVQAKRLTTNGVKLVLMAGTIKDTLREGSTQIYTINDIDYKITADYIDANSAKFTVNGELTRDMLVGETDKISNGLTIGVSDIYYEDSAGGVRQATFFLGSDKLELRDSDITDSASSNELKVNDETIDGAHVKIQGSINEPSPLKSTEIKTIGVNMIADDDYYVPEGGKLSEQLDEPDLLFTRNWDIVYKGLSNEATEPMGIRLSGNKKYNLKFNDGNGNGVSLPFIYATGGSSIKLGDDNDDLIFRENDVITKNDYFVVTDIAQDAETGRRKSFALRYKGADKVTADNPVLKFTNLGRGEPGSGETIELSYTNTSPLSTLVIGGAEFIVHKAPKADVSVNDFDIQVDLNGNGIIGEQKRNIYNAVSINTQYGADISIGDYHEDNIVLVEISTPNKDDYDSLAPTPFKFDLRATNGEVRMKLDSDQKHSFRTPDNENYNSYAYSSYGALADYINPPNDPQTVSIEYPKNQRLPMVYVTGKYTTSTGGGGGGGGSVIEPTEEAVEEEISAE